jgi:hypothetical protein
LSVAVDIVVGIKISVSGVEVSLSREDGHEFDISKERTEELEKDDKCSAETTNIT